MVDILAFGSHPDDIEFGCGGILCQTASEGKSIAMTHLTYGEKSSNGNLEKRREEAYHSAKIIGAEISFLTLKDSEIFDNKENRIEIVKIIRKYKPQLILAPFWKGEQNHPDHTASGKLARIACRYARFPEILPEIPPHTPGNILHYLPPFHQNPDFLIDVSKYVETWKSMMRCHTSQLKTYRYDEKYLQISRSWGLAIDVAFAQGLIKGNPVQIRDIMTCSKGSREI